MASTDNAEAMRRARRVDSERNRRLVLAAADAILKLRAIIANGDFDAYWHWHLDREHERNHPRSYALAA